MTRQITLNTASTGQVTLQRTRQITRNITCQIIRQITREIIVINN